MNNNGKSYRIKFEIIKNQMTVIINFFYKQFFIFIIIY